MARKRRRYLSMKGGEFVRRFDLIEGRLLRVHRHLQHRERRHTLQLLPAHPSHPCGARSRMFQVDQTARLRPVAPLAFYCPRHSERSLSVHGDSVKNQFPLLDGSSANSD